MRARHWSRVRSSFPLYQLPAVLVTWSVRDVRWWPWWTPLRLRSSTMPVGHRSDRVKDPLRGCEQALSAQSGRGYRPGGKADAIDDIAAAPRIVVGIDGPRVGSPFVGHSGKPNCLQPRGAIIACDRADDQMHQLGSAGYEAPPQRWR